MDVTPLVWVLTVVGVLGILGTDLVLVSRRPRPFRIGLLGGIAIGVRPDLLPRAAVGGCHGYLRRRVLPIA